MFKLIKEILFKRPPTFSEVYEEWKESKFPSISHSTIDGYKMAYKHAEPLHSMPFTEIKWVHLNKIIDTLASKNIGYSTKKKVKVLFLQLYRFAIINEYITPDKDFSRYLKIGNNIPKLKREPFNPEDIEILLKYAPTNETAETILIMIFSGVRVGELLNLKKEDVDLEKGFFLVTDSKTEAGRNRLVPINPKIMPFFKRRDKNPGKYVVTNSLYQKSSYTSYSKKFKNTLRILGISYHYPHDCRHTCASLLSDADANKVAIQRILGHKGQDITDRVYTHKTLEELKKAINLI